MCLIIAKPAGVPMPSKKHLKKVFDHYGDGYGVAFQHLGQVRLLKGAMTQHEMFNLHDRMKKILSPISPNDVNIVMQWRQAVTGSVWRKYCHPFPISSRQEELDSLDVVCHSTLAHNGVIWDYNKQYNLGDINDAQEFIKDYLVGMGSAICNPSVGKLIGEYTESKFAVLDNKGIYIIGKFLDEKGLYYSNDYYKYPKTTYYYSSKQYQDEWYGDGAYGNRLQAKPGGYYKCDCCEAYGTNVAWDDLEEMNLCSECYQYMVKPNRPLPAAPRLEQP